jgi:hypothetical protein
MAYLSVPGARIDSKDDGIRRICIEFHKNTDKAVSLAANALLRIVRRALRLRP